MSLAKSVLLETSPSPMPQRSPSGIRTAKARIAEAQIANRLYRHGCRLVSSIALVIALPLSGITGMLSPNGASATALAAAEAPAGIVSQLDRSGGLAVLSGPMPCARLTPLLLAAVGWYMWSLAMPRRRQPYGSKHRLCRASLPYRRRRAPRRLLATP